MGSLSPTVSDRLGSQAFSPCTCRGGNCAVAFKKLLREVLLIFSSSLQER